MRSACFFNPIFTVRSGVDIGAVTVSGNQRFFAVVLHCKFAARRRGGHHVPQHGTRRRHDNVLLSCACAHLLTLMAEFRVQSSRHPSGCLVWQEAPIGKELAVAPEPERTGHQLRPHAISPLQPG